MPKWDNLLARAQQQHAILQEDRVLRVSRSLVESLEACVGNIGKEVEHHQKSATTGTPDDLFGEVFNLLTATKSGSKGEAGAHEEETDVLIAQDLPSLQPLLNQNFKQTASAQSRYDDVVLSYFGCEGAPVFTLEKAPNAVDTMLSTLQESLPDASCAYIVNHILEALSEASSGAESARWFNFPAAQPPDEAIKVVAHLFHLSPDSLSAWTAILIGLSHGLACYTSGDGSSKQLSRPALKRWRVDAFNNRLSELSKRLGKFVERLAGAMDEGRTQSNKLTIMARQFMPQTYLQLGGQKLLYHFGRDMPLFSRLPQTVAMELLSLLYTAPFAELLRLAVSAVLDQPDGNMSPFVPQEITATATRDFKRIYPTMQDGQAKVKAAFKDVSATGRFKSFFNALQSIFKDAADFQSGCSSIAAKYGRRFQQQVVEALESDMHTVLLRLRTRLQQCLTDAILDAIQRSMSEWANNRAWMEVMMDCWPAAELGPLSTANVGRQAQREVQDRGRPHFITTGSYVALSLIVLHVSGISSVTPLFKVPLVMSILEGLQLIMDKLHEVRVPAFAQPSRHAMFLNLSAALCVQRRLRAFRKALDLPTRDITYYRMLNIYSGCMSQVDELVHSLLEHITTVHNDLMLPAVYMSIDSIDWAHFRTFIVRPSSAGPGPRMWRSCLYGLVHQCVTICSLEVAQSVIEKVLSATAAELVMRYSIMSPSLQRMQRYLADVAHLTGTAYLLTQDINMPGIRMVGGGQCILRAAPALAGAMSTSFRQLCMHAGLLSISSEELEDLFNMVTPGQPLTGISDRPWSWIGSEIKLRVDDQPPELQGMFNPLAAMDMENRWETRLGALWQELMCNLTKEASQSDLKVALKLRHELHEMVEGLPESEQEVDARKTVERICSTWTAPVDRF